MTSKHDAIDHAVQDANVWLKAVMEKLPGCDRHSAYLALRATLHALRDRLDPNSASHLGAQLPTLIRGIYYDGWYMAGTPTRERHKDLFLAHAHKDLVGWNDTDVELAVRAVFELLWEKIDLGEVAKVMGMFPAELRELWRSRSA
jgi:uncharacterized protein (DUF2267 family)